MAAAASARFCRQALPSLCDNAANGFRWERVGGAALLLFLVPGRRCDTLGNLLASLLHHAMLNPWDRSRIVVRDLEQGRDSDARGACTEKGKETNLLDGISAGGECPMMEIATPDDTEPGQNAGPSPPGEEDQHGDEACGVFAQHCTYLADLRHHSLQALISFGPPDTGLLSKWRMKDRMKTVSVALVVCLNIGVDPPDIIKVSPCARMECWIDPSSLAPQKALDTIGKNLQSQYALWQPRARYKLALDPTADEVKKLCSQCRKNAKSDRVLFHYNGHGVPKPTVNGELWFFNKSYTQYIPLSVYELESWLGVPSIYVLDCSGAGVVVNAFIERPDWALGSSSVSAKDCILLAACRATEMLPQSSGMPADVFTACLTTPIKMALRWFCSRSLLEFDPELIDKIPGSQNDRKTLLGELNWIFTAITDTIAWNVLPPDLFQRLFRQDLLVASLFRNFLLAERIMRSVNCSPACYPCLPLTHQHSMWFAWDMAAETCLSQLPSLVKDPNAEFQPSPFFTDQLTAFEVWLEHGSASKRPPEQLPIVLQVLLSQSHRFRALVLLGRFLDMGAWAVNLALSVGIFPYVLKLLLTTATELRQILLFIWAKILAHDKSCQVDLVKDGGHKYFIRFLDSPDVYAEQQAMAAFVLSVIIDGLPRGQIECFQSGLIDICLRHIVPARGEPLLMQWLCLCVGKIWDGFAKAQLLALHTNASSTLAQLLSEPQPEVRAAAAYALGTIIKAKSVNEEDSALDDDDEEARLRMEQDVMKTLLKVVNDGSPLVRAELAIALARLTVRHDQNLRFAAAAYLKPPSNPGIMALAGLNSNRTPTSSVNISGQFFFSGNARGAASAPASPEGFNFVENELINGLMRPRRLQMEESGVYVRCVAAAYSLVRDPCPWVAKLGHEVLRRIGVEAYVLQTGKTLKSGAKQATSAFPRSSSWFDSNIGSLTMPFRGASSSASPPSNLLSGSPMNMRRVPSLEFPSESDSGLGSSQVPASDDLKELPESVLYRWSCGHFARPLLETSHDEEETALIAREARERTALEGASKCRHSTVNVVTYQMATWDMNSEYGTKAVLLHPFLPLACTADDNETIRIWSHEDGSLLNDFHNHESHSKGFSRLCLINELDESLLLAASSDGSVRVWRDYLVKGEQQLATAWQAIQGHRPGARGINAVVEWQQSTGYLYASGDISSIMIWDVDAETLVLRLPSQPDTSVSAMAASLIHNGLFLAGCGNGSFMMFDVRKQDKQVFSQKAHFQRVAGIDFVQSGIDTTEVVSASQAGDIKIYDVRKLDLPVVSVEAHKGHLTSLAAHRYAPVLASGSSKQSIKVFSATSGDQLSMIRYHQSIFGKSIGPVSCLSFHPYSVLLAAGASTDSIVSIYAEDGAAASNSSTS
ncbi:regulatory-associated protein of TOR 2 [Selaginella moellendorffii]|uniref:regulatory-associated protein of TOR 2 n=1 Tax=Selaginella moellendorffii TaxID=88036 RepID=UPI000D1C2133|nr:regulatory-associated protein of TOR 2 [Selaginella moellendorffii]|eukprot:XP_024514847.1 regulatory-associated protein of TOR 2 [Selaginella moellendorffii]